MSPWAIKFCEAPFEADHILAKCYSYLQRGLPSHSFWRLCRGDGGVVEEIHGSTYCLDEELDWASDPKTLIVDMMRPRKNALFRLVAGAHEFKTYDDNKVRASVVIEDTEAALVRRWNAALQYADEVNVYLPRYHLLKNNCNTLSGAIGTALNLRVKNTPQAVGFRLTLSDGPNNQLSCCFNEQSGVTAETLHQQRQVLAERVNTINGKIVYLGICRDAAPELTVSEERPLKAVRSAPIELL